VLRRLPPLEKVDFSSNDDVSNSLIGIFSIESVFLCASLFFEECVADLRDY